MVSSMVTNSMRPTVREEDVLGVGRVAGKGLTEKMTRRQT